MFSLDSSSFIVSDFYWLTTAADQEVTVALFRRLREILASDAMREIAVGGEYWLGVETASDEEISAVVRESLMMI